MSEKIIQVTWAHPRSDSLTAAIVSDIVDELEDLGASLDLIDLYREGFDGTLGTADEPDWDEPAKQYTQEVMEHAVRTMIADAVVLVFPVWWFSLPGIMKGYIDRVWNYGLLYGGSHESRLKAVRWIGLAGLTRTSFRKRDYDVMMSRQLDAGIAGFCGIENSRLDLLYNTLADEVEDLPMHYRELRGQARTIVRQLFEEL